MLEVFLLLLSAYTSFGLLFAIAYCVLRLPENCSLGLRVILVPGAFALWPYLFFRWSSLRNDTPAATHT